jgi:hypothetical protein
VRHLRAPLKDAARLAHTLDGELVEIVLEGHFATTTRAMIVSPLGETGSTARTV